MTNCVRRIRHPSERTHRALPIRKDGVQTYATAPHRLPCRTTSISILPCNSRLGCLSQPWWHGRYAPALQCTRRRQRRHRPIAIPQLRSLRQLVTISRKALFRRPLSCQRVASSIVAAVAAFRRHLPRPHAGSSSSLSRPLQRRRHSPPAATSIPIRILLASELRRR